MYKKGEGGEAGCRMNYPESAETGISTEKRESRVRRLGLSGEPNCGTLPAQRGLYRNIRQELLVGFVFKASRLV